MNTVVTAVKLLCFPTLGVLAAAATQPTVIDQSTHVPLGAVCAIGVTAIGATFWLAKQLTTIGDRLKSMENRITALKCVKGDPCVLGENNE